MSDEPALFIVAASSRLARGRGERMVVRGLADVPKSMEPEAATFVARNRQPDGRLHAWSVRDAPSLIQYWRRVNPGDWMLFYQMGFITIAARVADKIESAPLAAVMWGKDEADELRFVVAFAETWPIWAKVWPHRDELGARFLGFRRLGEDRQAAVRSRYGSADAFVTQQLLSKERPPR